MLGAGSSVIEGAEQLTPEDRLAEEVYLGLRTLRGLPLAPQDKNEIARWIDAGWATLEGGRLVLSATGWLRLDSLAAALTLRRSHS
jgi:oxygen-independent coproporphyrinogen-3 oxidase